jgi:hypothetical protein
MAQFSSFFRCYSPNPVDEVIKIVFVLFYTRCVFPPTIREGVVLPTDKNQMRRSGVELPPRTKDEKVGSGTPSQNEG